MSLAHTAGKHGEELEERELLRELEELMNQETGTNVCRTSE